MKEGINKKILHLAGPSILANITVPLVGIVDTAIAGRLGDAAMIGGMAIGTMLFDLLYWNFGFLRVGTAGLTAQAYGRRDLRDAVRTLEQALSTAIVSALAILILQHIFVSAALVVVNAPDKVSELARDYFLVRVWAAPATLSLFAFKGWFLGMQNAKTPMVADITVNVLNLVYCYTLTFTLNMGFRGIALGTVLAQYSGLIVTSALFLINYRRLFKYFNIKESIQFDRLKVFFKSGGDLIIRSISFLLIYSGFTVFSAQYGDTLLAVSTIVMKLMLLYSYFIDGFAYAGEALTGKYVGARDSFALKGTIRLLLIWSLGIGIISTFVYFAGGGLLFRIMTTNADVLSSAPQFIPWLILMPLVSCIAFIWDGIYIGATATSSLRNTMVLSAISFFIVYFALKPFYGIHALMAGYFAHLIVRTILMSVNSKKQILKFI